MSNTFKKTSLRGFTLIELLVVIAIIGLLSTAIMGPVQTGLKKGRDTRKISDLTQVQGALLQYAGDNNGTYPPILTSLSPTYMAIAANMLGSTATSGLNVPGARDRFMYVTYSDAATTSNLVQYHLGVALENQNASLQSDVDCVASSTGGIINEPSAGPCAAGLGNGTLTNTNWVTNGAGNPLAASAQDDFGGAGTQEAALGVCTSKLDTCIFDIIPK